MRQSLGGAIVGVVLVVVGLLPLIVLSREIAKARQGSATPH